MECGGLYIVDEDKRELNLLYHKNLSKRFINEVSHYRFDTPSAQLVLKGNPIYIDYEKLNVKIGDLRKSEGLIKIAIVPILHEGNVVGGINIATRKKINIPVSVKNALEMIAVQIGYALARVKAVEEKKMREEELVRMTRKLKASEKKLLKANKNLQTVLDEKTLLIQDIHHRVKNNMTLIISLLSLEKIKLMNIDPGERDYADSIGKCVNRVNILASIYTSLYQSDRSVSYLEESSFFTNLIDLVKISYSEIKVKTDFKSDRFKIDLKRAITLGMLLNEILSNSFKHAFSDREGNKIKVQLTRIDKNTYRFLVSDNGIGFNGDIETLDRKSLGMHLIENMIDQLGAKMKLDTKNGFYYTIDFIGRMK